MPVVEPVANGGVGLPRVRSDTRVHAPFIVLRPASAGRLFAGIDCLAFAAMGGSADIVKVRDLAQTHFVAKGHTAIAVKQVRLVIVYQLLDFIEPLLLPTRVFGIPAVVAW